jgi:hypothetical protein
VIGLLEEKHEDMVRLCEKYRVKRFEVFGSAANGDFNPDRSDLDFLVEYQDLESGEHADAFLDLLVDLEDLFERRIDLIEPGGIRNPYFKKAVDKSRKLIYEG